MAKVTAPLFAIEASGKLGDAVVYDKRGFARIYTVPTNPKTDDQENVRCQFKAIAAAVKRTKNHARGVLKGLVEPSYQWSSKAIGYALKDDGWDVRKAEFNALEESERSQWQTNAKDFWKLTVDSTAPCFAGSTDYAEGLVMYIYAKGLREMGVSTFEVADDTPNNWLSFLNSN